MTREEAIRIIKIVLAVVEDFEIIVQGEEFTEEKCKEAVDAVIKALEQEPRWIPVSERLPKCCGMYLVTRKIYECPDTAPIIMTDESWFDGTNTWHNDNRINHDRKYLTDVIAWMPLPKPYLPDTNIGNMSENPTGSKPEISSYYGLKSYVRERSE